MTDCIWCNGENSDGSEWAVCSLTGKYNPGVLVQDYICPPCYKERQEEFWNLETTIMYTCDGAAVALKAVDATEEQMAAVRGKIIRYMRRLAGVEE